MLKNYLKITWRNIAKNKVYSFINIFGLSMGLTCCILISLYILYELSYDNYHKNVDNIYQLGTTFVKQEEENRTANTPALMAQAMKSEFPEIEETGRLLKAFNDDRTLLQYNTPDGRIKSFYESNAFLADSTFFRILTYNFKEGNPLTALSSPNTVVLSEEIADKIFGDEEALNKIIRIISSTNGENEYRVTGVFTPSKIPSHIDARFFMSLYGGDMERYINERATDLASNNMFYTYFLLKPGSNHQVLEAKFPGFIEKHAGKDLRSMGFYKKQFLTPIKDVHLFANTTANVTPSGSVTYLYILISIALFILLIAVINFMNLSTARSSSRSNEVGVRKVLGAEKRSLISLFLAESLMMSIIAFVFALSFAQMLLPYFSELSGKDISFSYGVNSNGIFIIAGFLVLSLLTGLLAGSYPAFYLSSFNLLKILKGRNTNSFAAVSLRKILVVFQFVISVILISSTIIIINQMNYLQSKDLGFKKDQQIVIPLRSPTAKSIYSSLKVKISSINDIKSVGASNYYPGIFNASDMGLYKADLTMNDSKRFFMNWIDKSFLQTMEIKPAAGRLFSEAFPADTNFRMILNEKGIKELGFSSAEEAAGSFVSLDWKGETYKWEIIGIVKDFHFKGLQHPIEPYGFQLSSGEEFNYLIAHANSFNLKKTLQSIENIWNSLNPGEPFEYSFLDENFAKNYESEDKLSDIIKVFTLIAILISCLGLFGLAAFNTEQRTKEIGVRKVLGASVNSIITLLSKDFFKLVLIAVIIAVPAAWFIMSNWLENFAYKSEITWWIFLLAAVIALLIAFITISFQAVKAATANPVKSLKYE